MLPKRTNRSDSQSNFTASERNLILAAETMRASESPQAPIPMERTEERISLFWRVFGGTILSITALIVINAYQSLGANIHELRSDLSRLRESAGDFIKKDDFNARHATMWTSLREAQQLSAPITALTGKVVALEQQIATAEVERRELIKELQAFRERLAKLEGKTESKPEPKKDH
ncbi:MAG: hypothetical protein U0746_06825 [Gemmataceae bacterium]